MGAWCLNEAIAEFGLSIEAAMDEASSSKKIKKESERQAIRQGVLNKFLGLKPKFRDPAEKAKGG